MILISKCHKVGSVMVMSKQISELCAIFLSLFSKHFTPSLNLCIRGSEFLSYIRFKMTYKNKNIQRASISQATFENRFALK